MGVLEVNKEEISKLCSEHEVKSLYSFGSVNSKNFNEKSDIDLVVEIATDDPFEYSDHYFSLKFELERILNRLVDLLENKAIKNPYFKQNLDQSKVLIYGR